MQHGAQVQLADAPVYGALAVQQNYYYYYQHRLVLMVLLLEQLQLMMLDERQ